MKPERIVEKFALHQFMALIRGLQGAKTAIAHLILSAGDQ